MVVDDLGPDTDGIQGGQERSEEGISIGPLLHRSIAGAAFRIRCGDESEWMTDVCFVGGIEELIHPAKGIHGVDDEDGSGFSPAVMDRPCDHITRQDLPQVTDVELTGGCDA